jgi:NAD(P)-dependent dehydrogenase (short-subunit alcohol dehydrogenase family)
MPSVLVTGASRGFGSALVGAYRRHNWTLFPLVRDPHAAGALAAEGSDRCHPICADVGLASVEDAITAVLAAHTASLDVLINNAGDVRKRRWLSDTTPEDIEEHFRVHCLGALRCTRAALPFLRRSARPTVVNISSRFGSIARTVGGEFRGIYSYAIAKGAQNMLTACLDHELRPQGIRVVTVHPGRLRTGAAAADADTEPDAAAERLVEWLDGLDRDAECALHDLMGEGVIPW